MKSLKSFALGMATILLFIPIAESLCEIICTGMEYIKGLVSKPVLKMNKELIELQAEQEPIETHCIGFEYNPKQEYYEDDYEEDFKVRKSTIGFIKS